MPKNRTSWAPYGSSLNLDFGFRSTGNIHLKSSVYNAPAQFFVLSVAGGGEWANSTSSEDPETRKRRLPDRFLISRSEFTLCSSFTYSAQILRFRNICGTAND